MKILNYVLGRPANYSDQDLIQEYETQKQAAINQYTQQVMALQQQQMSAGHKEPEAIDIQSHLEFILRPTGQIDMNIDWYDNSELAAHQLAYLLFAVNTGKFEADCMNLLLKIAQQNHDMYPFVNECVERWKKIKSGEGIVKPSQVFSAHNMPTPKGQ